MWRTTSNNAFNDATLAQLKVANPPLRLMLQSGVCCLCCSDGLKRISRDITTSVLRAIREE